MIDKIRVCCLVLSFISYLSANSNCIFPNHKTVPKSESLLQSIQGEVYNATDDQGDYLYSFGFCTTPETNSINVDQASVLQLNLKTKSWVVIGRYNDTDIKTGNNWGFVQYGSGDPYNSHCGNNKRTVMIMIICNATISKPVLKVIEENTNKNNECYYLFEIEHPKVCINTTTTTTNPIIAHQSLGGLSIAIIIIVSLLALYICGGIAYKKIFLGSKGVELMPNIDFWRLCGTSFANCVDCICRPKNEGTLYQRYTFGPHVTNNLTINDLEPGDDDDEILVLP